MLAKPEPVCNILDHTVENYLIKTFGENVYQELIDDVMDYSAAPVWDDEADYVLNDVVIYEGVYYKLIVANSTSSDTPNCNAEWEVPPKFNKTCFNEMFSKDGGGVLKMISWYVWAKAAPFYPNVLGLTDFIGEDKEYQKKINYYLAMNIYPHITAMEKRLWRWNAKNKCVSVFVCEEGGTTNQNQTSMNIAWD